MNQEQISSVHVMLVDPLYSLLFNLETYTRFAMSLKLLKISGSSRVFSEALEWLPSGC